jgi:hypothetical protein
LPPIPDPPPIDDGPISEPSGEYPGYTSYPSGYGGLVGYWPFQGDGRDHAGRAWHAEPRATATSLRFAQLFGRAGVTSPGDIAAVVNAASGDNPPFCLDPYKAFTISAWWANSYTGSGSFYLARATSVPWPEPSGMTYWYLLNVQGQPGDGAAGLWFGFRDKLGSGNAAVTNDFATASGRTERWQHVVLTSPGGNVGASGYKFYVDGRPASSVVTDSSLSPSGVVYSLRTQMRVGETNTGDGLPGASATARLRIYRRSLTGNEVAALYEAESPWARRRPLSAGALAMGGLTLFTYGLDAAASGVPLFVAGGLPASSGVTLFTHGSAAASSGATLFAAGGLPASSGVPLYVAAWPEASGATTLFAHGITTGAVSMPLSLLGETGAAGSLSVPLVTHGAAGSGWSRSLDLYLHCGEDGATRSVSIPLYLDVEYPVRWGRSLPLYTKGEEKTASASATLFTEARGGTLAATLFAKGDGFSDGYVPSGASLNLYLRRDPSAAAPLYLHGPGEAASGGVPLYAAGALAASGQSPLYCSGVGHASPSMALFTRGF